MELKGDPELTPSEVVYTKDRVKLLHYTPITKKSVPVPLLVVCALVNKYYIVDLQPDLSVIRRYLERGIDVYIIDWGDPAPSDRYETMGDEVDYIDAYGRRHQKAVWAPEDKPARLLHGRDPVGHPRFTASRKDTEPGGAGGTHRFLEGRGNHSTYGPGTSTRTRSWTPSGTCRRHS